MNTDTKHFLTGTGLPLIDPELLSEIVSTAADISLLIANDRRIVSVMVNPSHPAFGGLAVWVGKYLSEVVDEESYAKLIKRFEAVAKPGSKYLAVEINHSDQAMWEFPVRYSMHNIGADGSVLMMGRDMRPLA